MTADTAASQLADIPSTHTPVLSVEGLAIALRDEQGQERTLVDGVQFEIAAGETLGLVGESGCGKSLTAMSILGLLPRPQARVCGGDIRYHGTALLNLDRDARRKLRSREIAVIFQDPMTALNPVQPIGRQIVEVLKLHFPQRKRRQHRERAIELLRDVGIPDPATRLGTYPHQLSGGMRQRVMIALALACEPALLIADEPTTALDVTIQSQIIELLKSLQHKNGMAMLFITHDLGLVSQVSDHVAVMYAGKIVEENRARSLFAAPCHPYTQGLLAALPGGQHPPKTPLKAMTGQVPSVENMPKGCRFANRCDRASALCREQTPPMERSQGDGQVACHHWNELYDGD